MPIATVSEFLACLPTTQHANPTALLYRGQANSAWRVDCSAVRRLLAGPPDRSGPLGHALIGYLADLIAEASRYIGTCSELPTGCSELQLLAQLQHQGAATCLIDFTLDPFVGLWFACNGYPDEDGAVYVLSRTALQEIDDAQLQRHGVLNYFYGHAKDWEEPPYLWLPNTLPGRPASQRSAFVLGVQFVPPFRLKKAIVDKRAKSQLLAELRDAHGITEDNLFADLPGYSQANSVSKPLDTHRTLKFWLRRLEATSDDQPKAVAHVDCGLAYSAIGQQESAIDQYTIALQIDPNTIGAYANRAHAHRTQGDLTQALADYDAAIRLISSDTDITNTLSAANVYWGRGDTYLKLGQKDKGYADFNQAVAAGLKLYFNPNGGNGGQIGDHRTELEEYEILTPGH